MKSAKIIFLFTALSIVIPLSPANAVIQRLNNLNSKDQTLTTTRETNIGLSVGSVGSVHTFNPSWIGILQPARGGTGASNYATGSVLFFQNSKISEDNLNFFWNDVSKTLTVQNLLFSSSTGSSISLTALSVSGQATINSLTLSNPLGVNSGGTGNGSYTKGDILVAKDSNTLVRLPVGLPGQVLMVSSTTPLGIAWVSFATSTPVPKPEKTKYEISDGSVKALYHLEDIADSSGNGYDLVNASSVSFVGGKFANSAHFNGSNYLSRPIFYTATNNFTYVAWVYVANLETNGTFFENALITGQIGLGIGGSTLADTDTGNNLVGVYGGVAWLPSGQAIGIGWHLVGLVRDSGITKFFLDGTQVGSVFIDSPMSPSLGDFAIGRGDISFFKDKIDEMAVIDKVLSVSDWTNLYNNGSGLEICVTPECGN